MEKASIACLMLAAMLGCSVGAAAGHEPSARITTEGRYPAASREGAQVIDWLERRDAPRAVGVARGFKMEGSFGVLSAIALGGEVANPTVSAATVPKVLPVRGSLGDTIVIDWSTGGRLESWTFAWSVDSRQAGWQLQAYRYEAVGVGVAME